MTPTNISTATEVVTERAKERERLVDELISSADVLDELWDTSPDNRHTALDRVRVAIRMIVDFDHAAFDAENGRNQG